MSTSGKAIGEIEHLKRADGIASVILKPSATVDTIHNDEALKVLAGYDGESTWTAAEENKLRRKIDWMLMPVLCVTYGLQYYDKAMLSQAALFGLQTDLDLKTGDRYSFSASIFYLGFIVGAYPAMVLAQKYPVERVASIIVTLWGLCLLLTTQCTNYKSLFAQRFFLGFLEAPISPMFMLIVGSWYKKNEQAMRMGIWYSCTGYVSVFSPLINYGLGQINGGVSSWRYMYYFSGALTIVWGILLYFALPPDPIRAQGFDQRQRYILIARLRNNNTGVRNTHFKSDQVWELLLDVKFWLMFSIAFLSMIANGPISTFSPIIINGFGFSTLNSLLLVMPAGAYAGTVQLLFPYLASEYKDLRSWIYLGGQLLTTLAALLLWLLPLSAKGALLFAVYILPSTGGAYAVLMGLQIANTAGYTKRSLASSGLYIGYCLGNFVGPLIFKPQDAPRYAPAFLVVVITAVAAGFLAVVYRAVCVWHNNKRDKSGSVEGFDHAYEDDLTDIKQRTTHGIENCTNCQASAKECHLRTSRRRKRRVVPATQRPNRPLTPPQSEVVVATADGSSPQADLTLDTIHFSSSPGFQEIDLVRSEARAERPSPSVSNHTTSLLQGGQQDPSPSANSATSRPGLITGSQRGDIDTGFLHVYGPENEFDAQKQALKACLNQEYTLADQQQQGLMGSFSETYFGYCYPWCPVLDRSTIDDKISRSPLLANALAVAGSHVQPPLMPCPGPAEYYKKARTIFYEDGEMDELATLKSIALLYWWAPRPPSLVHRHSSWWWTSVSIRHAQQMNLHREPPADDPLREQLPFSLRRRIWWTAFARERLTALCQSKPVIIDQEDCSFSELVLEEFPSEPRLQCKGEVFIYWVRLCAIIGKVAKTLFRPAMNASPDFQSLDQHRKELVDWVTSLPPHLQLSIDSSRTQHFDRDVYQLHLPYLTTIIVLNLRRSAESLPHALPPAILAASCTSRILRDILARGNTRFLQAISCWYCGTAFIPLLQASWVLSLSKDVNASLDILERTVEQLQRMWATADVIRGGFRRLRGMAPESSWNGPLPLQPIDHAATGPNHENSLVSEGVEGFDWTTLFPFATRETSDIADILMKDNEEGMFNDVFPSDSTMFHEALMTQSDDPFAGGPDLRMEFMEMPP